MRATDQRDSPTVRAADSLAEERKAWRKDHPFVSVIAIAKLRPLRYLASALVLMRPALPLRICPGVLRSPGQEGRWVA